MRRNRILRAQGIEPDAGGEAEHPDLAPMPEVKLEDISISVAGRPRRSESGPTKLFVGGLSWDTTTQDLRDTFARFGSVVDATVILDRATGRSRGFGFVTFENPPDALTAIKEMDGAELDGRTLKVNRADSR